MRKILMLVIIVGCTSIVAGCGCGYSTCTSCCNTSYYGGCCGSTGWY